MKKLVLIIAAMLAFNYAAGERNVTYDNNGDITITTTSKKVAPVQTGHHVTLRNDSLAVKYEVYINPNSGRCFILRVSKKTGNQYRDYNTVPKETQMKYAQEMGIIYKEK